MPIDAEVADLWGQMYHIRNVPVIDGLLAATAKARNLILVTHNIFRCSRAWCDITQPVRRLSITPSHPGDFIRTEVIEELGVSATRVAEILEVRRATLSKVLNGHAALSPEGELAQYDRDRIFGLGAGLFEPAKSGD